MEAQNERHLLETELIENLIKGLLESADDFDEEIRRSIRDSVCELARNKTEPVLRTCHAFMLNSNKISLAHKIAVLNVIQHTCSNNLDKVSLPMAVVIIEVATNDIITSKEIMPDWQNASSSILVTLSKKYCSEVMESLLYKMQPGSNPHFYILKTMANIASVNAFGIVPFLKATLGMMIAMLAGAKTDNLKWVVAYVMAKFSDAITEYIANIDRAPDPTVRKEVFSTEVAIMFDIMFNQWLNSRETKLRLVVIEAIGYCSQVLSWDKLAEYVPKLIIAYAALYKKYPENFVITRSLCSVLDYSVVDTNTTLDMQFDTLMNVLFPQVCANLDFTQPEAMKNYSEVLRCFNVLARRYSDKLVLFLLLKIESPNEKIKIGSLTVFRHLINASESNLCDKRATIVSGLRNLVRETNNQVRKALAHLITAMSQQGYLQMEGSQALVKFIVHQCALPDDDHSMVKKTADVDYVSNMELRTMCENVLHQLTTNVDRMEDVLWPHLLQFLKTEDMTRAAKTVCKCVAHLAQKKKEDRSIEYEIQFDRYPHLPRPNYLFVRLLVLLGHPYNGDQRGIQILRVLRFMCPILRRELVSLWHTLVPKLAQVLEDKSLGEFDQEEWEEQVLGFLDLSLREVDNEDWSLMLATALNDYHELYVNYPEDKNFALKCVGVILKRTENKMFVQKHLSYMFANSNLTSSTERQGCAIAVGMCSVTHMDEVMSRLGFMFDTSLELTRKSSTLLSFITQDSRVDQEKYWQRLAVIESYGWLSMHAPPGVLLTKLEVPIFRSILQCMKTKDITMKLIIVETVRQVAVALHKMEAQGEQLPPLPSYNDLVAAVMSFVSKEHSGLLYTELKINAIDSCTQLMKLHYSISRAELDDILKLCLDGVYQLLSGETGVESDFLDCRPMSVLNAMLQQLLVKKFSYPNFLNIFRNLEPWMLSSDRVERSCCVKSTIAVFECYLNKFTLPVGEPANFDKLGSILGRLVARCADSSPDCRANAISVLLIVVRIGSRYDDRGDDSDTVKTIERLLILRSMSRDENPAILNTLMGDLANVLASVLPAHQLYSFLSAVMDGLLDPEPSSSLGSAVVLDTILRIRGGALSGHVETLVMTLHARFMQITCGKTQKGALLCIKAIAGHHLVEVLSCLFAFPVPFDDHVIGCWHVMAQDQSLSASIVNYCKEIVGNEQLFEEIPDPRNAKDTLKVAVAQHLSMIYSLKEVFRVAETQPLATQEFPRLFSTFLLVIGGLIDVYPPLTAIHDGVGGAFKPLPIVPNLKTAKVIPVRAAIEAFQSFLLVSNQDGVVNSATDNNLWKDLEQVESFSSAVCQLTRSLCYECPATVDQIVKCLNPAQGSSIEGQRIATITLYSEVINQRCCGQPPLLELLMNSLLARVSDPSNIVRRLSIRGLSSISDMDFDQIEQCCPQVLAALVTGLDDKEDPKLEVLLEAILGLRKLIRHLDEETIRDSLSNIYFRLKPCFERDNVEIRTNAIYLFGELSKFATGPSVDLYAEQSVTNLVCFILHLTEEGKVAHACAFTIDKLSADLGSERVREILTNHRPSANSSKFRELLSDLSTALIEDMPLEKAPYFINVCCSYFRSQWATVRAYAALLCGYLLRNLPPVENEQFPRNQICYNLLLLLKDSDKMVRLRASEAVGLLGNC